MQRYFVTIFAELLYMSIDRSHPEVCCRKTGALPRFGYMCKGLRCWGFSKFVCVDTGKYRLSYCLCSTAILGSSLNSVSAASPTNVSGGSALTSRTQTPLSHSMEGMRSILSVSPTHVQPGNLEQLASILQNHPPPPTLNSLPFNTLGVMDPVSSGTGECERYRN